MTMADKAVDVGHERIARVFRYLKALNEHRNPAKRQLSEQPWSLWISRLPSHPAVRLRGAPHGDGAAPASDDEIDLDADHEADFILKVRRPTLTDAPEP